MLVVVVALHSLSTTHRHTHVAECALERVWPCYSAPSRSVCTRGSEGLRESSLSWPPSNVLLAPVERPDWERGCSRRHEVPATGSDAS